MQDAAPEPEQVIASCGDENPSVKGWIARCTVITLFVLFQIIRSSLSDHPLRAGAWVELLCYTAWKFYRLGWRRPDRVELTRTTLRWTTSFRRVEVPLLSVREVHTAWRRNRGRKLVVDGPGPRKRNVSLSLRDLDDMDPFIATLLTAAPGIKMHVSPLSVQSRF